jgi:hypothetical protein
LPVILDLVGFEVVVDFAFPLGRVDAADTSTSSGSSSEGAPPFPASPFKTGASPSVPSAVTMIE